VRSSSDCINPFSEESPPPSLAMASRPVISDHIETWLCTHMPVATDFVNLVTVERFVDGRALGRMEDDDGRTQDLPDDTPRSFHPLVRHFEGLECLVSERP
jgi:hypothetical protein